MGAFMIMRGMIGLAFSALLLTPLAADWGVMFKYLSYYLILDGTLGLCVATVLYRDSNAGAQTHLGSLAGVIFVDAFGRIVSGIAVQVWPGIPGFPLTAVIFIGLMATFTAVVGFVQAALIAEEEIARHGRRHARAQFSVPPVLLSALVSVAFGVAALLFMGEPRIVRLLLAGYFAAAGMVMLTIARARHRMVRAAHDARPLTPTIS